MEYLLNDTFLIYKVKEGDSLSSIAVCFNTTTESVCELNGITQDLKVGQTIFIKPSVSSMRFARPFEYPYTFCRVKKYEHNLG